MNSPRRWVNGAERRVAVGLILVALTAIAIPAVSAEGAGKRIAPGSSDKIVLDERAGRFRRSFRLHVPSGGGDGTPRPLVVAIHGGFATARILEQQTALGEVADRAGFYVVYPNGLGVFSLLRHWNGGFCCGKAFSSDLDDPDFVNRVIEWAATRYPVDRRRIYLMGYSNGGYLAYWYASLYADRLAGLAIYASSIGSLDTPKRSWAWTPPATPLPAFIAHGMDDPKIPYDPGTSRKGQKLLGAIASAGAWAEANGCDVQPVASRTHGDAVLRQAWCEEGSSPVVLFGLEGWGHAWPGPKRTEGGPPRLLCTAFIWRRRCGVSFPACDVNC